MLNINNAPMVYFDQAPLLGVMHDIIEVDLSARVLSQDAQGKVISDLVCVAHLRCGAQAAVSLRDALTKALGLARYHVEDDYVEGEQPVNGATRTEVRQ